jgi:hypothetical protein
MTTPAHSPETESSQEAPAVDKRYKKVYVLWGIALTALITLGLVPAQCL